MTGKPLAVTQKQITAILKAAAKAGIRMQIIARNGEVLFVEDKHTDEVPPLSPKEPNFAPPPRKRPSFDI